MKNISLSFVVITLSLVQSTECGAGIVMRGLTSVAKAGLRQGGAWASRKAMEDPKATAAAGAGAYVGYRVAEKDSKGLGAVAGALNGWYLAKRHVDIKTIQAQLQVNTAQVAVLTHESAVQFATMEARLGTIGRQVNKLGKQVADTLVVQKNMLQQKAVRARISALDHIKANKDTQRLTFFDALKKSTVMRKLSSAFKSQQNPVVVVGM